MKDNKEQLKRKEIGQRINILQLKKGRTNKQLSIDLGITESHLCEIKSGKKGFSLKVLYLLCEALDVTPNDILGYSDYSNSHKEIKQHLTQIEFYIKEIDRMI